MGHQSKIILAAATIPGEPDLAEARPLFSAASLDKKGNTGQSLLSATQSLSCSGPSLYLYLRVVGLT